MRLYGLEIETDWTDLKYVLDRKQVDERELDVLFPGFREAILLGIRDLEFRRLRPISAVYRNFRLQVWPQEGFDADPSPLLRVMPANMVLLDHDTAEEDSGTVH